MSAPWAGDRNAGKEPGGQKEEDVGSPALGIGGITRLPRDLCIFSSLQCRYCPEICTWREAASPALTTCTRLSATLTRAPGFRHQLPAGCSSLGLFLGCFLFSQHTHAGRE